MIKKELSEAKKLNKPILEWVTPQQLVELDFKVLNEGEIKDRAKMANDLWERFFEEKLKVMIAAELLEMKKIETESQLMWLRGILAGFDIIKYWFEEQKNIASGRGEYNNNEE